MLLTLKNLQPKFDALMDDGITFEKIKKLMEIKVYEFDEMLEDYNKRRIEEEANCIDRVKHNSYIIKQMWIDVHFLIEMIRSEVRLARKIRLEARLEKLQDLYSKVTIFDTMLKYKPLHERIKTEQKANQLSPALQSNDALPSPGIILPEPGQRS